MPFDLKKIIQTIGCSSELNGKCSKSEYTNFVNLFILYNFMLFPLGFIYERSTSIIIFDIILLVVLFTEIVFVLTTVRRLNYLEYKVWWITVYIIFRGTYLFCLKMYNSQIFYDLYISLIATIIFILYLCFFDNLQSINLFFENIKTTFKFKNLQKRDQDNSHDHYMPTLIIIMFWLLITLIPGELKNIYSKVVSQFDNIIFEITKLDDRIVNPDKFKPINSNLESEAKKENKYYGETIEKLNVLGKDAQNEPNSFDPDFKLDQNELVTEDKVNSTSDVDKNWLLLKHTCHFDLFIDPVPISRTNKSSIYWLLMNYFKNHSMNPKIIEKSKGSISYNSEKYLIELHCKKRKERVLLDQYFSSQMGKGRDVYSIPVNTPEFPIPPKSIDEEAFNYICKGLHIRSGKECNYKQ